MLFSSIISVHTANWEKWTNFIKSATNLSCLDRLQNRSLRLIIGQLVSTPTEALHLEANVQIYHTCSNRLILKAREKTLRRTDDHPKRVAPAADIPQRLQSSSNFHWKTEELSTLLPPELQHRQNIIHFPSPPWQHSTTQKGRIAATVPGIAGRADHTDLKRRCSLTTIASHQANYIIYMDLVVEGQETGVQQQLVTRASHSSLKWLPPSKTKEKHLPAPMRRKQLPWVQHYPRHPPTPIILRSPYSFAQTANPYLKVSFHQILKPSQFTFPSTPYHFPSSCSGSLVILPFQVTI